MYKTVERDRQVDFSIPHFIASYGVFVPKDSDIRSVDDIIDRRILVQSGDLGHDYLVENGIGAEIVPVGEWEELVPALQDGAADCVVMGMIQGMRLLQEEGYRGILVFLQPLARLIIRVLAGGILALALAMIIVLLWNHSLKRRVRKQTAGPAAAMRELEQANTTKDRFLASMSHELRTPLHGIIGMSQLLEKTDLDARQDELLRMMSTASGRLYRILSDLLDTSRMNAGQLSLEVSSFSLRELSSWWEPVLRKAAEDKGLQLRLTVSGDDAGMLDIEVRDTGRGIAEEEQEEIFSPFTQVSSAPAGPSAGLGLGLFIVKAITELLGGTVGLEATRELRKLEAEAGRRRAPVIALTAHAGEETKIECTEAGMDGFICKPFGERALWAELERVLSPHFAEHATGERHPSE